MNGFFILFGVIGSLVSCLGMSPQGFLRGEESASMHSRIFGPALTKDGSSTTRQSLHYAVMGSLLVGKSIDKDGVCKSLKEKLSGLKEMGHLYDVLIPAAALGCEFGPEKRKEAQSLIESSETLTAAGIFSSVFSAKALGVKPTLGPKELHEALTAALKKEDSLMSLGYAFHLASAQGVLPENALSQYFDRIEDALVQADEIDGKMMQFEGGLATTNFILTGAFKLSARVGKPPPITEAQAVKFANYFVSRKSVQSVKGAFNLLEGLHILAKNDFVIPVAVTLASPGVVSDASPKIRIRVSDLLGNPVPGKMSVSILSAAPKVGSGPAILEGVNMAPVAGEASLFEADMKSVKPTRGFYTLIVNAVAEKPNKKYVGLLGAKFDIKVSSFVAVESVKFGVADADQTVAPKLTTVAYPSTFGTTKADYRQKIILKFTLLDKETTSKFRVHQAFLRFFDGPSEIIFIAEPEGSTSNYKFELNLGSKAKDFNRKSGVYSMELIIGDALVSNPISWNMGKIEITFPKLTDVPEKKETDVLPQIKHLFREPEKRPPGIVSNAFVILCLLPMCVMFGAWMKLGVNVSGFPVSFSSIGFHVGLGSIFLLYYYFWIKLNMFTTVKYLIVLGLLTFLCGNSMLSKIAEKKKNL